MEDKSHRVHDIAEIYGVHRSVLYRMHQQGPGVAKINFLAK
jgi:hypothetical protein